MKTTCPSCNQEVDASGGFCPSCGMPSNPSTQPLQPIIPPIARCKAPVDLATGVDFDRSGSTKQFEQGVHKVLRIILKSVEGKVQSQRVWVQTHSDLDYHEDVILVTDGGTANQAIKDSESIVFAGGGDLNESHLDGLESLLKSVPWPADPRSGRGVIISVTTSNTKPARSGITARQLGQEIKKRGLLLYLICEPFPYHYELAHEAGGLIFKISNNPDPKELEVIAARLSASITATVSSGATTPMTV